MVRVAGLRCNCSEPMIAGQTVDFYFPETRDFESAKAFLKRALANPDNQPRVFSPETGCTAIARPSENCKAKVICSALEEQTRRPAGSVAASDTVTSCVRCRQLQRSHNLGNSQP